MSPLGITLLLAVALVAFVVRSWRKLPVVAAMQPDGRCGAPLRPRASSATPFPEPRNPAPANEASDDA
jgi:hypothetical protein